MGVSVLSDRVIAHGIIRRSSIRSQTSLWPLVAIEAVAVSGVLVLATLARVPNLLAIPVFTDEMEEVARGLAILRDGTLPLTDVDPYIGPLWNYLIAGALWLAGPSIGVPRRLVLVAGVLTVLATYALGRLLYGRRVGLLGATLLATSATHIAVNSHVAWSNCLTPLFTTFGLVVLIRAVQENRARLLPVVGLLLGLAFHTHPTTLPVLVGAAIATLVGRPRWLREPWSYVAMIVAVIVNGNLVIYNLLTGGRTFSYAREIQQSYVRETGEAAGYFDRLGNLLLGLARNLGGVLDRRPTPDGYLREPLLWIVIVLMVLGLVLAVRRRVWMPAIVVGVTVVSLPLVNPKYDPILNGRYLAPILPLCLLWVAVGLEGLVQDQVVAWRSAFRSPGGVASSISVGLSALLATMLVVGSLGALDRYYDDVRENARTGERILEVVRLATVLGPDVQPVVLDERLDKLALGPGAGIVLRVLQTALELEGIRTRVMWMGEKRPPDVRDGQLVVLAGRSKPRFTAETVARLGLLSTDGRQPRIQSQASLYGVYRFGPVTAGYQQKH